MLALDSDEAGSEGNGRIEGEAPRRPGIAVRVASFPAGIKDANELLVSRNGDAGEAFRASSMTAEPRAAPAHRPAPLPGACSLLP